jgi:hypothetical protein
VAKCNEPASWGTYTEAVEAYRRGGYEGLGYELDGSGLTGIDLDHCIDPQNGATEPWAEEIITKMATYAEVSPSRSGVKLLACGKLPPGRREKQWDGYEIGLYDSGRFFTLTGDVYNGSEIAIHERTQELAALHAELFPQQEEQPHRGGQSLALDDARILELARSAKNAAKFEALWRGDWQGDYPSHSEADLALCSLLTFYSQDEGKVDRLFQSSGLYSEKWERVEYARATIAKAMERTEFYTPPEPEQPPAEDWASTPRQDHEPDDKPDLPRVVKVFQSWLKMDDPGALYLNLAAVVANWLSGDPVWIMTVHIPGGGKTEILNSLTQLNHIHPTATLTEAALLSGTSKKDRAPGAKGGLLNQIGAFGIILIKDFGSILTLNKDTRGPTLQALREIYDGSWTRHVGTDGGRTLSWAGKIGMIAGATPAIDAHHGVMAILGERFVYYRLPVIRGDLHAKGALKHLGREQEMRQELASCVKALFGGLKLDKAVHQPNEEEAKWLIDLACLSAQCRAPVIRNFRQEVEVIPGAEAPTRLVLTFAKLLAAMRTIGVPEDEIQPIIAKVALDSMPVIRYLIIRLLAEQQWVETPDIAVGIGYPTNTTRMALQDLNCYSVVEREHGHTDRWRLESDVRKRYEPAKVVHEKREHMYRGGDGDAAS